MWRQKKIFSCSYTQRSRGVSWKYHRFNICTCVQLHNAHMHPRECYLPQTCCNVTLVYVWWEKSLYCVYRFICRKIIQLHISFSGTVDISKPSRTLMKRRCSSNMAEVKTQTYILYTHTNVCMFIAIKMETFQFIM